MKQKRKKRGRYGPKTDLTGQRFGYLEVIRMDHLPNDKRREYKAVCNCYNCGKTDYWVFPLHLRRGQKSCGCLKGNRKTGKDRNNYTGYGDITGTIWGKIKTGARRRKLEMSVTIEEAWKLFEEQNKKCALSGLPITMKDGKRRKGTASLDRKNNIKGYIKGNVQWIHRNINIIKHSCSQEYFVNICRRVVNNKDLKDVCNLSEEEMLSNELFARGC
tara:strand:- start:1349 stop:1999 length:651 start_codon:yes stop_codon:yes gene_type:complete